MLLSELTVPRIDIEVAKQMADAGEAILVDVRTRATFEQAHIAGAISMPSGEVLDRYQELPTNKLVIFY
jgi:rhodanese-related sulfurtransferase